jgi:hypothetical protein
MAGQSSSTPACGGRCLIECFVAGLAAYGMLAVTKDVTLLEELNHPLVESTQRRYCIEAAQFFAHQGEFGKFVECMRLWRSSTEAPRDPDADPDWDSDQPAIWRCCPTAADEEACEDRQSTTYSKLVLFVRYSASRESPGWDRSFEKGPTKRRSGFRCHPGCRVILDGRTHFKWRSLSSASGQLVPGRARQLNITSQGRQDGSTNRPGRDAICKNHRIDRPRVQNQPNCLTSPPSLRSSRQVPLHH